MNLFEIMERFPTHASCIEYLEGIRWRNGAHCPHCGSVDVYRKRDGKRIGRWHCKDCSASYNVLQGTVLQGTKMPLQKWFVAVTIIVNAKKSVSSCQLGRDLGLNQKSAWYMMQRIRAEMASKNDVLLRGIIEADETYLGGRPRRPNRREDDEPAPQGRGTSRTPELGTAERDGNVVAEVAEDLTGRGILNFVRRAIQPKDSVLITDEYRAYRAVRSIMPHEVINHSVQYVGGQTHTNTIEGFWSLLKGAWYGSHHHYTRGFTPLYVAEACYKYNNRRVKDVFSKFLKGCFA